MPNSEEILFWLSARVFLGIGLSLWRSLTYVLLIAVICIIDIDIHFCRARTDPILSTRIKFYFEERAMEGEQHPILCL